MGFDAAWLTLREPADARARATSLRDRALRLVGPGDTVLDLGCGTGATPRAFAAQGATDLHWRLFDNDPDLLAEAAAQHPGTTILEGDLADIEAVPLEGAKVVTASALLDLVSRDWLERFAERLSRAGVAFYAVLSYDGRMRWTPGDPADAEVTAAFNAHQRGDKGLGPALGPDAGETAADVFRAHGFEVTLAQSPWQLGPDDADLHDALLSGIAQAATEAGCDAADAWLARRRGDLAQLEAEIGHLDLLAVPQGRPVA
ncbi:methyltransferase domain-containing protein [Roseovarius sp. D22-M7]|uniref:methyltransferase domain-containing protein n=1 Tax=Roseovarius sp. D22-M7 TaxID=3127116 RepID=UPI00300FC3D4